MDLVRKVDLVSTAESGLGHQKWPWTAKVAKYCKTRTGSIVARVAKVGPGPKVMRNVAKYLGPA